MSILEDNTIKLRAVEPIDLDIIYEWENNPEVWNVSNTITPFSRHSISQFIESSDQDIYQLKQLRLMIDLKSSENSYKTIGTIDLFDFDAHHRRAGVGILIADKTERSKGYATMALSILAGYAFDILLLHQLYCNIGKENTASLTLFQKVGFSVSGEKKDWIRVNRGWQDELFLQLLAPE